MINKLKTFIPTILVVLAVMVIAVVGHRNWFKSTPSPVITEPPAVTQPVEQPARKKKPRKVTKPAKPVPQRPEVVPVPPSYPYRVCDETGWCWTYF